MFSDKFIHVSPLFITHCLILTVRCTSIYYLYVLPLILEYVNKIISLVLSLSLSFIDFVLYKELFK